MYKGTWESAKYTDLSNDYYSHPAAKQMGLSANNITKLEEKRLKYFFTNIDISNH